MCDKVSKLLNPSNYHVLDNNIIKEKNLGKRGLHLNIQENAMLASNSLHAIRNQEWSSNDSNLVKTFSDDNQEQPLEVFYKKAIL